MGEAGGRRLGDVFPAAEQAAGAVPRGGSATFRAVAATGDRLCWQLDFVPHPEAADALLVTACPATAAATESQERLSLALEAGGLAGWEADIATGRLIHEEGLYRLAGLPPTLAAQAGGIVAGAFAALIHPEDRPRRDAALAMAIEAGTGAEYRVHFRIRHAGSGEWRWISTRGRIVAGADGRPARLLGISQDITERRLAEANERRHAEMLRRLMDSDILGITVCQGAWVLEANDAWLRLTGTTREALERGEVSWQSLTPPEYAALDDEMMATLLRTGRAPAYEKEYQRPDGTRVPVLVGGALLDAVTSRRLVFFLDLSSRRAAEASLARYQVIARQLRDVVLFLGLDGRILDANAAAEAAYGHSRAALLGMTIQDLRAPETLTTLPEDMARAAAGGTLFETRHRRADGSTFPVEVSGRTAEIGGERMLVSVVRDITDRHRVEAALRESAARLARVQQIGRVGGFEIDLRSGINRRSAEYMAVQGFERQQAEERHEDWVRRLHPEDRERAEARFLAAVAEDSTANDYAQEYRVVTPEGEVRWIAARAVIERDAEGRPLRMLGAHVDVTELKAAEAALAESEARFRALVDAMPQLAFTARPDGSNDYNNRRWFEYTGRPPREGGDADWMEALHPEDRAATAAAWAAATASGAGYEVEHRLRGADGTYRCFLTRAVPLRRGGTGDGEILHWFGTSTDISEIVAAREAAARATEELERRVTERTRALSDAARELQAEIRRREEVQAALLQSQKLEALGQLTGGVAHDFNNILAAIQGGYRLLERRVGEDARTLDLIRQGRHAAERGARLIAQLMGFARKQELHPRLIDPAEVLLEAEEMLCHTIGSRILYRLELHAGLWPVLADPVRLETVLLNLASNARDAMPEGGTLILAARNAIAAELPPDLPPGRDYVLISVADTGTGMDAETLHRATEPFFTTKPPGKGTGLGLASAHGFAAQSGGALHLSSTPGVGTRVEIFLPRAGVVPAGATRAAGKPAGHGDATILVVDDDDGVRPVTAALLRDLGYRVIEAPSAEAAEALMHATPGIDMLITDVVMPGAPGQVLARRLRAERPKLPVLYITGHSGTAALDDAPVLRKPFTDAALAVALLNGLGRRADEVAGLAMPDGGDVGTFAERLRHESLRDAYRTWLEARDAAGGRLPSPADLAADASAKARDGHLFIAEAASEGVQLQRLGVEATAKVPGPDLGVALDVAFARCAATRMPFYEIARHQRGPALFERLFLPLSADGALVTHLAGMVRGG